MRKTVLVFGLISGAISTGMMAVTLPLLGTTIDWGRAEVFGYTALVLSALVVFFGIRSYREGVGASRITFGRGFAVGLLITLIASACYVAAFQVIYFKLTPDFGEKFTAAMVDQARASGASPEKIEETARRAQGYKRIYDNPLTNAGLTFLEPFPIGLVVTAISAAILRKR